MKPKRPPTAAARRLHKALSDMVELGKNGEQANARVKLARLLERYDFTQPDLQDIFAGVFYKAPYSVPIGTVADNGIASAVKWAIEGRTGIACRFQGESLLAEATPATAQTLVGIVGTVAAAFAQLWQTYASAGGLPGDRNCFLCGLFDGMMQEERTGQLLPSRIAAKAKRRGKVTVAPGLAVHPYSLALAYGRQIRFSVPLAEVDHELKDRLQKQIEVKP